MKQFSLSNNPSVSQETSEHCKVIPGRRWLLSQTTEINWTHFVYGRQTVRRPRERPRRVGRNEKLQTHFERDTVANKLFLRWLRSIELISSLGLKSSGVQDADRKKPFQSISGGWDSRFEHPIRLWLNAQDEMKNTFGHSPQCWLRAECYQQRRGKLSWNAPSLLGILPRPWGDGHYDLVIVPLSYHNSPYRMTLHMRKRLQNYYHYEGSKVTWPEKSSALQWVDKLSWEMCSFLVGCYDL